MYVLGFNNGRFMSSLGYRNRPRYGRKLFSNIYILEKIALSLRFVKMRTDLYEKVVLGGLVHPCFDDLF